MMKTTHKQNLLAAALIGALALTNAHAAELSSTEARAIAKEPSGRYGLPPVQLAK